MQKRNRTSAVKALFWSKKGGAVIHIGAGVILLALLVLFVLISQTNPALANQITNSISSLASAVK